jgi:hypothetical protein
MNHRGTRSSAPERGATFGGQVVEEPDQDFRIPTVSANGIYRRGKAGSQEIGQQSTLITRITASAARRRLFRRPSTSPLGDEESDQQ